MTDTPVTGTASARGARASRSAGSGRRSRQADKQSRTSRTTRPTSERVLAIAGAVIVAVVLAIVVDLALSAGRIHPGVRVGGVPVGRMTTSQAAAAIREGTHALIDEPVRLEVAGETWEITADEVSATVDATGLAEAAYGVGRSEELARSIVERMSAWIGAKHVPLTASADGELVEALFDAIDAAVGVPAVNATVRVDGTSVMIVSEKSGKGLERALASRTVLAAFTSQDRTVPLSLVERPAAIKAAAAAGALETAKKLLAGPVELTYDKKAWNVPAVGIAGWLAFRPSVTGGGATELECYLDSADVSATVVPLIGDVVKLAKNATFRVSSGAVSIVPSQDGLGVDADDLVTALMLTLTAQGETRSVELPMKRVEPDITTEDARAMGIKERLSTYTTDYSPTNLPRVNNIHLLAGALDGTLIPPGGVFSFNETIGPRTAEKGYQEANAIVNGKLVPQLGGGVCQVGTTIFNTVFFSGLPVVERHNHSLYISHYPKGRDATVSWGGPDIKFKNDTEHWILIATAYTNSTVTISLYGTEPGYKVSYETGAFYDVKPYPVREIKDPTLPVGTRIIDEKGVNGRSVIVTRVVTKGGAVIRTDTFKSVYKAGEEVVRVGTKVVTPSDPTTTTP